ncbi:unnamed protein product [Blepharisma stoltei]|uniref:Uncharacterized protein n=1 Tax=Blepharisma stoltei TaxID=1481888 RepID=A0AAU9IAN2_9CILI|nr:unnamed protein product [Blepharisma stoltei]
MLKEAKYQNFCTEESPEQSMSPYLSTRQSSYEVPSEQHYHKKNVKSHFSKTESPGQSPWISDTIRPHAPKTPNSSFSPVRSQRKRFSCDLSSETSRAIHHSYGVPKTWITPTIPEENGSKHSIYDTNIGPGDYDLFDRPFTPGGYISAEPRFENTFEQKVESFIQQVKTLNKRKIPKPIFVKNVDLSRFSPPNKERENLEKFRRRSVNFEVVKLTRSMIEKAKKVSRETKYREKMQKYAYNQMKSEAKQVMKSWILLMSIVGFSTVIHYKAEGKKKLKCRAKNHLTFLLNISRAIGKFRILLNKVRWNLLKRKLKEHFPIIQRWVKNRRNKFLNAVTNQVEVLVTGNTMFDLMLKYRKEKKAFQSGLLSLIKIRKARILSLNLLWEKVEESLSSFLKKSGKLKVDKIGRLIPKKVREECINKYYNSQVKLYLEKLKLYKTQCKEIEYLRNHEMNIFDCNNPQKESLYPPKPTFQLYSNYNVMRKIMLKAYNLYADSFNEEDKFKQDYKNKIQKAKTRVLEPAKFHRSITSVKNSSERRHFSLTPTVFP